MESLQESAQLFFKNFSAHSEVVNANMSQQARQFYEFGSIRMDLEQRVLFHEGEPGSLNQRYLRPYFFWSGTDRQQRGDDASALAGSIATQFHLIKCVRLACP
jgi:hypothetical protein